MTDFDNCVARQEVLFGKPADGQPLHDKIADHLQKRYYTLYKFGHELESGVTEWCVRDKTLPDYDDTALGASPSGGIVRAGFTSEEADKLLAWILAGEVLELINQEGAATIEGGAFATAFLAMKDLNEADLRRLRLEASERFCKMLEEKA